MRNAYLLVVRLSNHLIDIYVHYYKDLPGNVNYPTLTEPVQGSKIGGGGGAKFVKSRVGEAK